MTATEEGRRLGRRRAASGGRHSPGRVEDDQCENHDINPMQRENGVRPAQARLPSRHRAARVAGTRPAGAKTTTNARITTSTPCNVRTGHARRRPGWSAGAVPRRVADPRPGRDKGDQCENHDINAMQRENGAPATQARLAGRHRAARVAGARPAAAKATTARIATPIPCNVRTRHARRRPAGGQAPSRTSGRPSPWPLRRRPMRESRHRCHAT